MCDNIPMHTKLVIFGVTGDLSRRKLLPALRRVVDGLEDDTIELVGISRQTDIDTDKLFGDLAPMSTLFSLDLADVADYRKLATQLHSTPCDQIVIYLSVPPLAVVPIVERLGQVRLNGKEVKLLLEKPFGIDQHSADEAVKHIAQHFDESQLYRIDHYLAKEMAQNIVAFRGGNALFANTWNNQFIEKIEIIASEKIGIEGRQEFYEQTGALRDVLQGHLMQLLALSTMQLPSVVDWDALPLARYEFLTSLTPADPLESVRAQYDTYQQEVDNPGSPVETFVGVTLYSTLPQWQGVEFVLVTGKALAVKTTEIRVYFRKTNVSQPNRLVFRIQPSERITLELFAKKPGYERQLEPKDLSFRYPPDVVLPEAYEQVLVDAIRSHKSTFASSPEILESWRVLQPLLDAWAMNDEPLATYQKGTDIAEVYPKVETYFDTSA